MLILEQRNEIFGAWKGTGGSLDVEITIYLHSTLDSDTQYCLK